MKEYLNDLEIEKVDAFVKDRKMFEAVRKVLLAGIYQNGTLKPGEKAVPTKNFALNFDDTLTNEQLGEALRANTRGVYLVEVGFQELEKIAPQPVVSPLQSGVNPAE